MARDETKSLTTSLNVIRDIDKSLGMQGDQMQRKFMNLVTPVSGLWHSFVNSGVDNSDLKEKNLQLGEWLEANWSELSSKADISEEYNASICGLLARCENWSGRIADWWRTNVGNAKRPTKVKIELLKLLPQVMIE